ncbi:MAG TPA: TIGR01777 family oxidoreductase [Holophagaceae bacterium]|nr:TIGR01777 family oxidoreductase [Holophagaceae bacterium]
MTQSLSRAVVAGGTGLIGQRLVAELLRQRVAVTVLTRDPAGAKVIEGAEARSYGEIARALEGADAVFNLAGASIAGRRWSEAYKRELVESRVATTAKLVEAMDRCAVKPKVLVNASAIGWYGPRGIEPLDETAERGGTFLADLCRAWEAAADGAKTLGIRVVKMRTGVVLAKEGGALSKMAFPVKIFQGAKLGRGDQGFSWIHIDDLVAMYVMAAANEGWSGAINATAPEPLSNAAFTKLLGKRLHRPILPVPGFITAAAVKLLVGELSGELLTGAYVLPKKAEGLGFAFRFKTAAAALADLIG